MKVKIIKINREKNALVDLQKKYISKDEISAFAKNQFLRLIKKNLQVPVSIMHL